MRTLQHEVGTVRIGVQGEHSIEWFRDTKAFRGVCLRLLPCVSVSAYRGAENNFSFRLTACWLVLEGTFFVERVMGCRF